MTLNEIIYSIFEVTYSGVIPDSRNISEEYLAFEIATAREMIIKQFRKTQGFDEVFYQYFCMELIEVDEMECCDITIPNGCKLLRTEEKVPNYIKDQLYVYHLDRSRLSKYNNASRNYVTYNKRHKYTDKFFIENNYIYVISTNPLLTTIKVKIIASNPIEVFELECKGDCDDYNMPYPIDGETKEKVVDFILKNRIGIILSKRPDTINDKNDAQG